MKPNKTRLNWVNSEPTWPIEPVFFASRPANQFSLLFFGWMDRDGLAPFSFLFSVLFFLRLSLSLSRLPNLFRRLSPTAMAKCCSFGKKNCVLLARTEFYRVFIMFYWVLPSFTGLDLIFVTFYWVETSFHHVLLGFTEFSSCLTGFYPCLLGFTEFYWILSSFTGFFTSFTAFYWVILSFTRFYWLLLGLSGVEWV